MQPIPTHCRRLLAADQGTSMIEMALVAPLLLAICAGIAEFGVVLYQHQLIETGVRDAARYLSRVPDPSSTANQTIGQRLAVTGRIDGTGTARVSWWTTANVTVAVTNVANPLVNGERTYRGPDPLKVVRVSTTATYPGVGMLRLVAGANTLAVNFFHEERVVGE